MSTSLSELAGYVHFSVRVNNVCPASLLIIVSRIGKCIKTRMEILTVVVCNSASVSYVMSSEREINLIE